MAACQLRSRLLRKSSNVSRLASLQIVSNRFSTAFDPYWYLHQETVVRDQQRSFLDTWEKNPDDFKSKLTPVELAAFQKKVEQIQSLSEFEEKLKGLYGPKRHHWVRKTRTWEYVNGCVQKYLQNAHPSSLIFGDDDEFEKFQKSFINDPVENKLLAKLKPADLRYMCALQCFDAVDGPKFTAVFGCRNKYHHVLPNAAGGSAHWMNSIHDRVKPRQLVILCALQSIKEDKPISPDYFREKLEAIDHNALKDEEWREYAKTITSFTGDRFFDQLDRAFVAFQTDPGVTKLQTRFDTDIDYDPSYSEDALWGEYKPTWGLNGVKSHEWNRVD